MKLAVTISFLALALSDIAQAGCTLYEHRDYGGRSYRMGDNTSVIMASGHLTCGSVSHGGGGGCSGGNPSIAYDAEASRWNDRVSSFKVTDNCTLTLYEHIFKGGARFVRSNNVKYIGGNWNDIASDAHCRCN